MRTRLVYATLFSAALLGSGALAQTAATDNPAPPMKPAPSPLDQSEARSTTDSGTVKKTTP
jgi:hypothetical protein